MVEDCDFSFYPHDTLEKGDVPRYLQVAPTGQTGEGVRVLRTRLRNSTYTLPWVPNRKILGDYAFSALLSEGGAERLELARI